MGGHENDGDEFPSSQFLLEIQSARTGIRTSSRTQAGPQSAGYQEPGRT